jgi:hypothetical protein
MHFTRDFDDFLIIIASTHQIDPKYSLTSWSLDFHKNMSDLIDLTLVQTPPPCKAKGRSKPTKKQTWDATSAHQATIKRILQLRGNHLNLGFCHVPNREQCHSRLAAGGSLTPPSSTHSTGSVHSSLHQGVGPRRKTKTHPRPLHDISKPPTTWSRAYLSPVPQSREAEPPSRSPSMKERHGSDLRSSGSHPGTSRKRKQYAFNRGGEQTNLQILS